MSNDEVSYSRKTFSRSSLPRSRESRKACKSWIPACAGMTKDSPRYFGNSPSFMVLVFPSTFVIRYSAVYPPELLPNGMSSGNMFLVNDVEILNDNMFCDLGCQVNKVHIVFEAVECFDSMVVLEIAVDGSLRMV